MTDTPSLFAADEVSRPRADRLRPHSLTEVVGQSHVLADDGPIGRMVAIRRLASMVLWGPPGCEKTTIAGLSPSRPVSRPNRCQYFSTYRVIVSSW